MTDLRERLRDAPLPEEDAARERAWRLVAAAAAEREPASPRLGRRGRLALVAVATCALLALIAATPPGDAVADWLRDVVRRGPATPRVERQAIGPLPGGGRLLVMSRRGPWIVQADGSRRRLGTYDAATFSPQGLFVAVARDRMLAAVDPRGGVRWTLTRHARITRPAWSPDGLRVAYRSGSSLRVVYGDGAFDRGLAASTDAVTPAWQPGAAGHRLAHARGGAVVLRDTDSGRVLWRVRPGGPVRALAWSPDGRRLAVVTRTGVMILGLRGVAHGRLPLPHARVAAWLPGGRALAVLSGTQGTSEVHLASGGRARRLLALPGRLDGLLVSPDGRWLLLDAREADQWLLMRTSGTGRLAARSGVARQFDPGGSGPGRAPRTVAWIR